RSKGMPGVQERHLGDQVEQVRQVRKLLYLSPLRLQGVATQAFKECQGPALPGVPPRQNGSKARSLRVISRVHRLSEVQEQEQPVNQDRAPSEIYAVRIQA